MAMAWDTLSLQKFEIPYCSIYGDIIEEWTNYKRKENKPTGKLLLTGEQRTGCVFCGFGCHLEKEANRFQRLKISHPNLYDYCMRPELYKVGDSNRDNHKFVSKDRDGNILGLIAYGIDVGNSYVNGIGAINFSNDKVTYGRDLLRVMMDIFDRYNFRKITFGVVVGNPAERSYDRLVHRFGGRIVGVYKQDCKLIDNKLYDNKVYEILREDYIRSKAIAEDERKRKAV